MSVTDQIADMLTRIRNAVAVSKKDVSMPSCKIKVAIAEVLKREGYVADFEIVEGKVQNQLCIRLKYGPEGEKVISHIKRESAPGCRKYIGVSDIRPILNGLGISVQSTNQGVLSDREAREKNVGGELLCSIW